MGAVQYEHALIEHSRKGNPSRHEYRLVGRRKKSKPNKLAGPLSVPCTATLQTFIQHNKKGLRETLGESVHEMLRSSPRASPRASPRIRQRIRQRVRQRLRQRLRQTLRQRLRQRLRERLRQLIPKDLTTASPKRLAKCWQTICQRLCQKSSINALNVSAKGFAKGL